MKLQIIIVNLKYKHDLLKNKQTNKKYLFHFSNSSGSPVNHLYNLGLFLVTEVHLLK